jgi:hypothetical protein
VVGNGEARQRGKGGGGEEYEVGRSSLWRRMRRGPMGEVVAWGGNSVVVLLLPRVPCSPIAGPPALGRGKWKERRKKKRKEKIEKEENKMWKNFIPENFWEKK